MDFTNLEYKKNIIQWAGKIIDFLNSYNISFFITAGTALGYLRENDLIDHDNDFDFGILAENWKKEAHEGLYNLCEKVEPFYKKGFNTEVSFPNQYGLRRPGVVADIYFYYKGEGKKFVGPSRYTIHYTEKGIFEHRTQTIEKIKPASFCGLNVYVPKNIEQFIIDIYGNDWKKPIKKDDQYTDFHCKNFVPYNGE